MDRGDAATERERRPLDLRSIDFPHPWGVIIPQARVEALLE